MTIKSKINKKETLIGSWLTLPSSAIAEIMAKSNVDWLAVDMEHSALTVDQCQELIRVIDLSGVIPFVRVGQNDKHQIKRVMDLGAKGVIVPMVNSEQEAKDAVEAVKYAPEGHRGVGLFRAHDYGVSFEKYMKWVEKESIVIVQIEHIDAVNNLESILKVKGVDGFIVGPYDLSSSLGVPGDFEHKKMLRAMEKIRNIVKDYNGAVGFHVVEPNPEMVLEKIKEGYNFIAYSVDFLLLGDNFRKGITFIRNSK